MENLYEQTSPPKNTFSLWKTIFITFLKGAGAGCRGRGREQEVGSVHLLKRPFCTNCKSRMAPLPAFRRVSRIFGLCCLSKTYSQLGLLTSRIRIPSLRSAGLTCAASGPSNSLHELRNFSSRLTSSSAKRCKNLSRRVSRDCVSGRRLANTRPAFGQPNQPKCLRRYSRGLVAAFAGARRKI